MPQHRAVSFPPTGGLRAAVPAGMVLGDIRGQLAPGDIAGIHAVTTWWHQKGLSAEELITTSCSPWLGKAGAVSGRAVVAARLLNTRA